jgi:alpha-L-fucosidase
MKPQLKELLEKYDPAVLWFDGEWIPEWTEEQGKELYNWLRAMKPDLIINNRVGKGRQGMQGMNAYAHAAGDFGTPEQEILEGTSDTDWESCMTMNDSWGFKKNDLNWKSSKMLIDNLIDIAAKGGNYLLNVGPESTGLIPQASVERLAEMGKWLNVNGEAIYATKARKQYKEGDQVRFTVSKDDQFTYAIITGHKDYKVLLQSVKPAAGSKVRMLGVKSPLPWKMVGDQVEIQLPLKLPTDYAWVLKIQNN